MRNRGCEGWAENATSTRHRPLADAAYRPDVGVCLIGGDRPLARSAQGDRLVVGKSCLIQRLGAAMWSGILTVGERAPGRELLRGELERFVFKPGARGWLRLEAARGHDDLVIATALAVLASDLAKVGTAGSARGRVISR